MVMLSKWMVPRLGPMTVVFAVLATTGGCRDECDLSGWYALGIQVVDAQTDAPIGEATIRYTVDGDEQEPLTGTKDGEGRHSLGFELAGSYEVAVSAPGYAPAIRTYEIEEEECHVVVQADAIALTAE